MLIRNVWQTKGLYNGALGTVRGLIYGEGKKPPTLPLCILIEFDNYSGPSVVPGRNLVPIVLETIQFESRSGVSGSRQQFPLTLGWAITLQKSQGLTLRRVILDIGNGESHLGITYVGCSRVKSFKGLAFNKSFSWERLDKVNKSKSLQIMKKEVKKLEQLL